MYGENKINGVISRLEACDTGFAVCIDAQLALEKARDEIRQRTSGNQMAPEHLSYLLNHIGLTQRQLAAMVGQSTTSVNAWVKGRAPVPPWLPIFLAAWMLLTDEQREQAKKDAGTLDAQ